MAVRWDRTNSKRVSGIGRLGGKREGREACVQDRTWKNGKRKSTTSQSIDVVGLEWRSAKIEKEEGKR